jgi:hypothetical protein
VRKFWLQPNKLFAFSFEEIKTAGSPGRLSVNLNEIFLPVILEAIFIA